jgi:hypothetical protein
MRSIIWNEIVLGFTKKYRMDMAHNFYDCIQNGTSFIISFHQKLVIFVSAESEHQNQ